VTGGAYFRGARVSTRNACPARAERAWARREKSVPHDGQREPSEQPEPEIGPTSAEESARLVRAGLLFYGAMAAAAVLWRVGLQGGSLLYASAEAAARGVEARDLGLGVVAGVAVVGASALLTELTGWGEGLARALARALGPLGTPDAVLLAAASGFAEEALFRGALQPAVGWVAASLLFGVVHFVPRREFLPWTAFAVAAGFGLGWLYDTTGNLAAPMLAHTVVNAVNLPLLVRRYGAGSSSPP
jgi:membrane protease YdiL (CAAX protease family)